MAVTDEVSVKEVAAWLNLTPRRIQQLAQQGVAVKAGRGKYHLKKSVQGYVRFLSDQVDRTGSSEELAQERLLTARAERQKKEIELARVLGTVISHEHHERLLSDAFELVRARLRHIPGKVAPRLVGLEEARDAQAVLVREVDEALRGLVQAGEDIGDQDLPDSTPGHRQLRKAGITTVGALARVEDFTTIKGIGDARARRLRQWLEGREYLNEDTD